MTVKQRMWRCASIYGSIIVAVCGFVMMTGYVSMAETDGPSLGPLFKIFVCVGAIPLAPGIVIAWAGAKLFHTDSFSIAVFAIAITNLLFYIPLIYWFLRRRSDKNA